MHEKVREFIETQKAMNRSEYVKEKQETLLELGICEKVYSPNNEYNEEYPYGEVYNGAYRYYKKIPIYVTDEEYEEIKKYTKMEKRTAYNTVAKVLAVIGWLIYIGGFILGIYYGYRAFEGYLYYIIESEYFPIITLCVWASAFVSGTVFLGFAEIIKLLHAIKNK